MALAQGLSKIDEQIEAAQEQAQINIEAIENNFMNIAKNNANIEKCKVENSQIEAGIVMLKELRETLTSRPRVEVEEKV